MKQILDGCTAAAHIAYALSDIATVYPITPIAAMGDTAQKWGLQGRLNLMGQTMEVREMESELGAAGALHGVLAAGSLATTFTSSQGLMLMIPNMYKIAGELLPAVFHVGCRSLATHALSIFGDHQDVMACRATGFAQIVSSSVQETMDLALVAHLAAIEGSLPVLHFFDGWRTSNEMNTIDVIDYDTIRPLVDWDKVSEFRHRGLNPDHPKVIGSAQNPDVYFQNREAANLYYDRFPDIVKDVMLRVGKAIGREYHTVDYHGAPNAENIIVIMGSGADVVSETVDYLNKTGNYKTGVIKIRLYRPFPISDFIAAIPRSVKTVTVLDRTKEPGAQHEPLCLDVISALYSAPSPLRDIRVTGGRYGLSSKEFNPSMVKAVFDEAKKDNARSSFTVGINDDVTKLSLDVSDSIKTLATDKCYQAIFYGIGNDGTVGGVKQAATIFGNRAELYAQAYFNYSAKKSGGYTISQLRIGKSPITSAYGIDAADYIACHKATYVRRFEMLDQANDGAVFVLNSPWTDDRLVRELPLKMRQTISSKKIKLYNIDADRIAASTKLSPRINMPMMAVMFYLSGIIDFNESLKSLQETIRQTYSHEGEDVVNRNIEAINMAIDNLRSIDYGSVDGWLTEPESEQKKTTKYFDNITKSFIENIHTPCIKGKGDDIPVSALSPDGSLPMGTTAYEHRRIATKIPVWDADKCVECTECSLVCPHAAIRPFILNASELADAPKGLTTKAAHGSSTLDGYYFRIQNYPEDCLGCASCSLICPGNALSMTPVEDVIDEQIPLLDWLKENVTNKEYLLPAQTVNGSQLRIPGLEFSGACAGCGETPYVKLLTQLFGSHLIIANATGCSSIWGANFPSNAYCRTDASGRGPAWGNSLFEDNAEYGFGMLLSVRRRRERLASIAKELIASDETPAYFKAPIQAWLESKDDLSLSLATSLQLKNMMSGIKPDNNSLLKDFVDNFDMLSAKSVWSIGGDGWAYDIGFAGLDHVLASGEPVKILVMDTECYSNTGGHASKATPRSCVAMYAADGKPTQKKDLGRMMMTYGNVYVASVALGANYQQTINALVEAERYPGPAIVIAYCPCITHGIHPGLGHSIVEERRAVEAGYWPLYRFNPEAYARGEEALTIDSVIPGPDNSGHNGSEPFTESASYPEKEPLTDVRQYVMGDSRYSRLNISYPNRAAVLRPELDSDCNKSDDALKKI